MFASRTLVIVIALQSIATAFGAEQNNGSHLPQNHINPKGLSQGGQMWWNGPVVTGPRRQVALVAPTTPNNVDAANPNEDLAPGQSETAIAAHGNLVMEAWNDATSFVVSPTTNPQASGTGVGFSRNGAKSFKDLVGLPNNNPNEVWSGDPSVVAIDNGNFFIVSSIYAPRYPIDCTVGPAQRR